MSVTFTCRFALHSRVVIDGDDTIVAVVTQVCWGDYGANVQVSWFTSGYLQTAWVAEERLTQAPDHLTRARILREATS